MAGAEAVFAMGAAAMEAGDLQGAERLFHQIVEVDPRAHPAWNALSVVAVRAGLPEIAAEHAQRALTLDRRNPLYLNNLGVALGELGRFKEAEQFFRRALKAKPVYPEGLFNLGKVLYKMGQPTDALRIYERTYAIDPKFPGLRVSLIQALRKHGLTEKALAVLQEDPRAMDEEGMALYSDILFDLKGAETAIEWLRSQMARNPDSQRGRFSLAQKLLAAGYWREGWHQYFWRTSAPRERIEGSGHPVLPQPLPPRLEGNSVLLRRDQGMGDGLFFLRFAPALRARGASVAAMLPRNLARVVSGDFEVIEEKGKDVLPAGRSWDYILWIGDLPAVLESTATPPSLRLAADGARIEQWRQRLAGFGPPPYLGLTWRAGTDILRGREFGTIRTALYKEIPHDALGRALRGWRGTLLALQRGPYPGEIDAVATAAEAPLHDLSSLNDDLPEMMAVLALIDEYVAVSNTNIHLVAALGRSARVLVPYPAEWRWMSLDGPSPWFPGFPVYREPKERGWTAPLERLRSDVIG